MKRNFFYIQPRVHAGHLQGKNGNNLQLEIQMVHATLFGKHEKTWAVILGSAIFLLFGGLFSHQVKSYSFMFMHKISTQVVCVKGNQLYGIFSIQYWILKKCQAFIHGIMT